MQKVKQIFSNKDDETTAERRSVETSPRDSVGSATHGYNTTGAIGKGSGNTTGDSALADNTTGVTSSGLGSNTSSGLSGSNVHSGSTGVGSNIGRDTSDIAGGKGLGNAATAAGSAGTVGTEGHSGALAGNRTSGLTGDRSSGLTGDRVSGAQSTATAGTRDTSGLSSGLTGSNNATTGSRGTETGTRSGAGAVLDKITGNHSIGHDSRTDSKFDPTGENTHHDHKHLQHVTHAAHRHMEVEEVQRERDHHRHVHHLQHHVQPVLDTQVKDETHHVQKHPVTNIEERHVNTGDDVKLFSSLGEKHRDQETHMPKERTVVDLGEKVNTTTHHHVHHVTQPIVEQEIHNRHRIHTTIPLTHTVHEAPIIHKSSLHEPVHMTDFVKGGGKLDSGVRHNEAGLLSTGDCDRRVDGVGEKLAADLNLKPSNFSSHGTTTGATNAGTTGNVGSTGAARTSNVA